MLKTFITSLFLLGFFTTHYACFLPLKATEFKIADLKASDLSLAHFQDFPAAKPYTKKPKPLKLNSHPEGRKYRTVLRKGIEKGPNFAGELAVITHGCGSGCQMNWVVNLKTGEIIDHLDSNWGAEFYKESNLLILDPITERHIKEIKEDSNQTPALPLNVRYYVWDGNKLNLLQQTKDGFNYIKTKLKALQKK